MVYIIGRVMLLLVMVVSLLSPASASVVMSGTRIIYPSDAKSVDVQLKNNDSFPYVIQAWFDSGDISSRPDTAKAPFMITPSTFKMSANGGQVLRAIFTGSEVLPRDRESVFYFNFIQIPPANIGEKVDNKILIVMRNRMKVFYRPVEIKENRKKLADYLKPVNATATSLRINNTSPFYVPLSNVSMNGVRAKGVLEMIPPFSHVDVGFHSSNINSAGKKKVIKIEWTSDYGGTDSHEYTLN